MLKEADLVLKNVMLPEGRTADLSITDGTVCHVGAGIRAEREINCSKMICLPGAVDMHVHMRGGSQSSKEDWKSGSMSAVAGGVTMVVDQPNTVPPITTTERLEARIREAASQSLCNFAVNSAVSADTPLEEMWRDGAMAFGETFAAPSSYGDAISGDELKDAVRRISQLGALLTIHAETVTQGDDTTLESHDGLRSAGGEMEAVRSISRLGSKDARMHFCHLSTAKAVDLAAGSVEVSPHHLFLSYEAFEPSDGRGKVNPPLRTEKERRELWSRWARIDVIASDHAPHTAPEKRAEFPEVPAGIPGVETMVPLLLACALNKRISIPSLIEKTVTNPAKILRIPAAGYDVYSRADFALFRPAITKIDPDRLHSRSGWTPFEGMEAIFPEIVIRDGTCVFEDGEFKGPAGRWLPGAGYISR